MIDKFNQETKVTEVAEVTDERDYEEYSFYLLILHPCVTTIISWSRRSLFFTIRYFLLIRYSLLHEPIPSPWP